MYTWAMFFITSMAISIWYIIFTDKKFPWIIFLICAEGAAYTHYYAALFAAIEYVLLAIYIFKYARKKYSTLLLVGVLAILLYLPWIRVVVNAFSMATGDFWLESFNIFQTIKDCVSFVFRAGNVIAALFFIILFLFIFMYAITKKSKSKKDLFAFANLFTIIIFFYIVSIICIMIRPLFVAHYLFPACGLIWIFFAIECGSIKNCKIFVSICTCLVGLILITNSLLIYTEHKENNDFLFFHKYLSEKIMPDDIFIYTSKDDELCNIFSYLFPRHIHVIEQHSSGGLGEAYRNLFKREKIPYTSLTDPDIKGRSAWIFESKTSYNNIPIFDLSEINGELCGSFGWERYKFELYHAKIP
jgi:hypothetical protein